MLPRSGIFFPHVTFIIQFPPLFCSPAPKFVAIQLFENKAKEKKDWS
jgi:hypothetical protein